MGSFGEIGLAVGGLWLMLAAVWDWDPRWPFSAMLASGATYLIAMAVS